MRPTSSPRCDKYLFQALSPKVFLSIFLSFFLFLPLFQVPSRPFLQPGLRRSWLASFHISSCISIKPPNAMTDRKPDRAWTTVSYLSALVLLSSPPVPRFHLGPHRTSRRSDSPGSRSSLHGGSRPAYRQPSLHQCPLRCFSGILDVTEPSSNAAAMIADLS